MSSAAPLFSVITATHNPQWLGQCYDSLKKQICQDFEWCITTNGDAIEYEPPKRWDAVPIVHRTLPLKTGSIGAIKDFAFRQGRGRYLFELDHDDVLDARALDMVRVAIDVNRSPAFIYSDTVDWSPERRAVTYHDPGVKKGWRASGWRFSETTADPIGRGGEKIEYPLSWEPSAAALSLVYWTPNHLRCWKREFFEYIGGHNPELEVCDDNELLIRTYLFGNLVRIPEPLYWYRVTTENSWQRFGPDLIRKYSTELRDKYLYKLVLREMELRELPCYDLGGQHNTPGKPWLCVDREGGDITCNLEERWPFEDSSVGAFRAFDVLEHLPNKLHTMSEIHRCLAPGGWLLSMTPSATGPGAFQDPTHVSYWVENSFRYYTTKLRRFLPSANREERFLESRLNTIHQGPLPYVRADLYKHSDNLPGVR